MTPDERNRVLHEKVMGRCWHEFAFKHKKEGHTAPCVKCNSFDFPNPDYSKWEFYGPMLEWAMKQEWWRSVAYNIDINDYEGTAEYEFNEDFLNPLRGSTAIAEFLEER